jgi:hypothetical protein
MMVAPAFTSRVHEIKKEPSTLMRYLLLRWLAALTCFGVFSLPQTSAAPKPDQSDKPDFNGTWALDLKASASLEPIMKKVGARLLEQKFASLTNLKATIQQTEQVITVATRGRGFALDETLYPDGRSYPSNLQLLGANCLTARTAWSRDQKQLVVTYQIKTKQGKEGQLIVTRYLINEGKTEVVVFTLKLNTEPDQISARQIWTKQA